MGLATALVESVPRGSTLRLGQRLLHAATRIETRRTTAVRDRRSTTHMTPDAQERIAAIRPTAAQSPHGTRARYVAARCRCLLCRAAASRYECERDARRRAGDYRGLVSAQEARDHILALGKKGIGYRSVAAAASVARSIVAQI